MNGHPAPRDPFTVLGVPRDASPQEVSLAYRRLLRRYHPDSRGSTADGDLDQLLAAVMAAYRQLQQGAAEPARPAQPPHGPATQGSRRVPRPSSEPPIRVGPVRWWPSPPR